jgi:membrane protease YdiL (CAAX protease family)
MLLVDHVFILLLFIVLPLHGVFETRRYDAQESAGQPFNRIRFYRHTAIMEWAYLAALAGAWFAYGRPLADLGFVKPGGAGFWVGLAVLALFTGVLLFSWRGAQKSSADDKAKQRESLGKLVRYLPHNGRELRGFIGVSLTAGIVEEIVYRGFVLWYLGQIMPLWAAVAVSSFAFGLAHSYQGANGAMRCGLTGLAFGIFYVVTGSIWLPIIAHVLLDVLQGAALREILGGKASALQAEPA